MNAAPRVVNGKRATIRDVAAHAGVSSAAVSKVLRDAYGVSPQMRSRVERAIDELGYRPSASARGMRGGKTYTLGMVVGNLHNPFVPVLAEGAAATAREAGYEVMLGVAGGQPALQHRAIESMIDRQIDGIILAAPLLTPDEITTVAERVPIVVIGRYGPAAHFDTVTGNDLVGARMVVDHFVELGHRSITFIGHPDQSADPHFPHSVRQMGYEEAMHRHGLDDAIEIVTAEWTTEGGRRAARRILERPLRPTAIFAGADVVAMGVLAEFSVAGVPVPGTFSLAGFDNTPNSDLPPTSLTTIDQSGHDIGSIASRLLIERVDGRAEGQHIEVPSRLLIRGSSAAR